MEKQQEAMIGGVIRFVGNAVCVTYANGDFSIFREETEIDAFLKSAGLTQEQLRQSGTIERLVPLSWLEIQALMRGVTGLA